MLRSHTIDFEENFPAAVMLLLLDMYMDYILHPEKIVEDAVLVREDLQSFRVAPVSVPKRGEVIAQRCQKNSNKRIEQLE